MTDDDLTRDPRVTVLVGHVDRAAGQAHQRPRRTAVHAACAARQKSSRQMLTGAVGPATDVLQRVINQLDPTLLSGGLSDRWPAGRPQGGAATIAEG